MKKSLLILLILLSTIISMQIPAFACGNEETEKLLPLHNSGLPLGSDLEKSRAYYADQLESLQRAWLSNGDVRYYSDYGLCLMYLGRYKEAEKVFTEIERLKPGQYATAANLGTTYELMGKKDSAYKWISRAVQIYPASHDSSEWLHVKILEVKIKGDQYNTSKYLLGVDFGSDLVPVSNLPKDKLEVIRDGIVYQLEERMTFIKPKDKIVALLLFELGNTYMTLGELSNAEYAYRAAMEYGYQGVLLEQRYAKVTGKPTDLAALRKAQTKPASNMLLWSCAGAGMLLVTIIVARRRRK